MTFILHPDDVARLSGATDVDGEPIVKDAFGVTKPGEGYRIADSSPMPWLPMPRLQLVDESVDFGMNESERYHAIYTHLAFPRLPRFQALANIVDDSKWLSTPSRLLPARESLKQRDRRQRRLDRDSRARTRKRRKELERRRAAS